MKRNNPLEDQIIDQRMNELNQTKPSGVISDTEKAIYTALTAEFPREAMTADKSRGFALTSIKAQYITERLNDVIGFMNWSHGGTHEKVEDGVLYHGALLISVNGRESKQFSTGYAKVQEGKNLGDAYKSAKTDSLSKAASLFGIGNSVFKGLVDATTLTNAAASAPVTARAKKAVEASSDNVTSIDSASSAKTSAAPAPFKTRRAAKAAASDDGDL